MRRTPPKLPKDPPPEVVASPRLARLVRTLGPGGARSAHVTEFWREVELAGTPLIEADADPAYRIVTFLWRGGESTRGVVLMANKLTDPSVFREASLELLPGTDIWHRSFRLRSDWRASYRLAPDEGPATAPPGATAPPARAGVPLTGPASRWREFSLRAIADPRNPRQLDAAEPGGVPLSIAELPDAPPQPWLTPRPSVARGAVTVHRLASAVLGNERDVWVYRPAAPRGVLVVLDGEDWVRRLQLPVTLDNLIAAGAIPPVAAAFVSAIDVETRWTELSGNPAFLRFLDEELLPWLDVAAPREATVLAGRSLGALTALYAGLRGSRFGALLCQSASLWQSLDGEEPAALAARSGDALHAYLEVGRDEWVLLEPHRRLRDVLRETDWTLTYREYSGGHDPLCWRGGIADGLVALLGRAQLARP